MAPLPFLTPSERSARRLLAAWNTGELVRLEDALLAALERSGPVPDESSEQERIDLIRQIARTIRAWLRAATPAADADLKVSLGLLRHLARCERGQASGTMDSPAALPVRAARCSLELLADVTR